MATKKTNTVPWLLWPFVALWDLLATIIRITGRIIGILLALVFMVAGIALTLTLAAAPLGIPLAVLGLLLMIRSIF